MGADFINNIFRKKEQAEDNVYGKEKENFEACVMKAYENPNTLEYTKAVDKANELINMGLTSGKMISRGGKAAKQLCGPETFDPAVVVGAMKKIEELKKNELPQN